MTELLTADQMRGMEQAAIESGQITGLELMERAGRGVVEQLMKEWPAYATGTPSACVLCGPGNNGGDGFVVARVLQDRGWDVRAHFWGETESRAMDARIMHGKWVAQHEVLPLTADAVFGGPRPDVIVDAIFGIGLKRPLPQEIARILDRRAWRVWKAAHKIKMIAVDCPSGLDLDWGIVARAVNLEKPDADPWPDFMNLADLTVTFHAPKLGHFLAQGPGHCKTLRVVDIGLQGDARECAMIGASPDPERVRLVMPEFAGHALNHRHWPSRHLSKHKLDGHKYDHGHVVVHAGGVGRGGAARLAARAALRCGAGLVTVLCPPSALIENACQLNAIMLQSIAKDTLLADVADHRVSAFCLGPGMGVSPHTRSRVIEVLQRRAEGRAGRDPAVVLDADALTSFAEDPALLFQHTHARAVLTPHDGEFARLFPDIAAVSRSSLSKVDAVRQAADRAGCIVLLKGPDTVIAQPGGGAAVHSAQYDRQAPWLATAGAGDVLAGLIAGLSAPRTSGGLFEMTEIAAYLHVEAARRFGPGLIAEDLPEQIPLVYQDWGL